MSKLKKQQLEELRAIVGEIRLKKISLSDIQMSIMDAQKELQITVSSIRKKEQELKDYNKKLEEKLGDVEIDLNTGEYKTI